MRDAESASRHPDGGDTGRSRREKRADKIQRAQIEAAKDQAKIQAEKELSFKELGLTAQDQASTYCREADQPVLQGSPGNRDAESAKLDAESLKLPAFIDEKDKLDSYLFCLECYDVNAIWEKNMWAIKLSALLIERAIILYNRMSNDDTMTTIS